MMNVVADDGMMRFFRFFEDDDRRRRCKSIPNCPREITFCATKNRVTKAIFY